MREIKFRAWNIPMKHMDYRSLNSIAFGGEIYYGNADMTGYPQEIMQYTGLKDKNGKEIYEGDIIEIKQGLNQKSFRGSVIYSDYMFDIEDFYLPYYDYPTIAFSEGTQTMEVIGNIYENPELLEVSE